MLTLAKYLVIMGYSLVATVVYAAPKDMGWMIKESIVEVKLENYYWLRALGQIETGVDDKVIGKNGEVSRFQILPRVWKELGLFPFTKINWQDPNKAAQVAELLIKRNELWFKESTARKLDAVDAYIMWNAGFSYYKKRGLEKKNVSKRVLERAKRYDNLLLAEHKKLVTLLEKVK